MRFSFFVFEIVFLLEGSRPVQGGSFAFYSQSLSDQLSLIQGSPQRCNIRAAGRIDGFEYSTLSVENPSRLLPGRHYMSLAIGLRRMFLRPTIELCANTHSVSAAAGAAAKIRADGLHVIKVELSEGSEANWRARCQ